MVEFLADQATGFFDRWSYPAAFLLMAMESMIAPVPSEVVMPPIGMLVAQGRMSLTGSLVATSLGSIAGSLISYAMGYYGGKPVVLRWGRWLLLNEQHLAWTEGWFRTHGRVTIFVGRFIPVVRHLISIPAGVGRMPLLPFSLYTLVGATLWNAILLGVGMWLGENWTLVLRYRRPIDVAVVVILAGAAFYFYWHHLRPARHGAAGGAAAKPE